MAALGGGGGAGPATIVEKADAVARVSACLQDWLHYSQVNCCHDEDTDAGDASVYYDAHILPKGHVATFKKGQVLIVFVTSRVELDPLTHLAKEDLVPFHKVNADFHDDNPDVDWLIFAAIAEKSAAYPFLIEQYQRPQPGGTVATLIGSLLEGVPPTDDDALADDKAFHLFDTDVRAQGGHKILVGARATLKWRTGDDDKAYRRIVTPSAILATVLGVDFYPNEEVGGVLGDQVATTKTHQDQLQQ